MLFTSKGISSQSAPSFFFLPTMSPLTPVVMQVYLQAAVLYEHQTLEAAGCQRNEGNPALFLLLPLTFLLLFCNFLMLNIKKYKQHHLLLSRLQVPGPIFFYFGNEDNVELYVNHTGLMWESAEEFGAALVFAEHRFYVRQFSLIASWSGRQPLREVNILTNGVPVMHTYLRPCTLVTHVPVIHTYPRTCTLGTHHISLTSPPLQTHGRTRGVCGLARLCIPVLTPKIRRRSRLRIFVHAYVQTNLILRRSHQPSHPSG